MARAGNRRGRSFETRVFNVVLVTVTLGTIAVIVSCSDHEDDAASAPPASADLIEQVSYALTGPGGCLDNSQLDNNRIGQPAEIVGLPDAFRLIPADPSAEAARLRYAGGKFLVFASSAELINGRHDCNLPVIPDQAPTLP